MKEAIVKRGNGAVKIFFHLNFTVAWRYCWRIPILVENRSKIGGFHDKTAATNVLIWASDEFANSISARSEVRLTRCRVEIKRPKGFESLHYLLGQLQR